ncbi:class I SAM-dependent methyltransferase [Coralloluteibacterium stylophorae]|uniref:Class I SAM-dependent methyltransferase n=1 Tax=Coralloluteibacterium stylophorae TaxID=1776034 RepID=A0A8J8AXH6_9GAMM|nr:class I SAM-dependent methyltransferase [Coralloluteibacterium stylophorae]MBS7455640.1 class I SAM-dependent methyltransferase [Coralloluteibacterium stylophorae]
MSSKDSVGRFDDRVEDYVRYRPDYPRAMVDWLLESGALAPGRLAADVGAGTGISTLMLLEAGLKAIAVEPNAAMRAACLRSVGGHAGFRGVLDGRADALGLDAGSVDLVAAAQAFHWFERAAFRRECARVLRPGGHVVVFWNTRPPAGTPFLDGYEALLRTHGDDYAGVAARYDSDEDLRAWLGDWFLDLRAFPHRQLLDRTALRGRFLSSSYAPAPGHPRHAAAMQALNALFDATATDGRVSFDYLTRAFVGRIPGPAA